MSTLSYNTRIVKSSCYITTSSTISRPASTSASTTRTRCFWVFVFFTLGVDISFPTTFIFYPATNPVILCIHILKFNIVVRILHFTNIYPFTCYIKIINILKRKIWIDNIATNPEIIMKKIQVFILCIGISYVSFFNCILYNIISVVVLDGFFI